jgi:hypothetical protein
MSDLRIDPSAAIAELARSSSRTSAAGSIRDPFNLTSRC